MYTSSAIGTVSNLAYVKFMSRKLSNKHQFKFVEVHIDDYMKNVKKTENTNDFQFQYIQATYFIFGWLWN